MQDEWQFCLGSASASWREATFQFRMQMQIREWLGLLLVSSVCSFIRVGSQNKNNVPMAPINFPLAREWNRSTQTYGGRMAWNLSIKVLRMKKVALFSARRFSAWTISGTSNISISLPGRELERNSTSHQWRLEIGLNLRVKLWNNGDTS